MVSLGTAWIPPHVVCPLRLQSHWVPLGSQLMWFALSYSSLIGYSWDPNSCGLPSQTLVSLGTAGTSNHMVCPLRWHRLVSCSIPICVICTLRLQSCVVCPLRLQSHWVQLGSSLMWSALSYSSLIVYGWDPSSCGLLSQMVQISLMWYPNLCDLHSHTSLGWYD